MKLILLLTLLFPTIVFANTDFEKKTFYCKIDNAVSIIHYGEIEIEKFEDLEIVFISEINLKDNLVKISDNMIKDDENIKYSDFLQPEFANAPFIIDDLVNFSLLDSKKDNFINEDDYKNIIFAKHSIINSANFIFDTSDSNFKFFANLPGVNYITSGLCTSFN